MTSDTRATAADEVTPLEVLPGARSTAPIVLIVLACLSWGSSTVLTKVALVQLTPTDLFAVEIASSPASPTSCSTWVSRAPPRHMPRCCWRSTHRSRSRSRWRSCGNASTGRC